MTKEQVIVEINVIAQKQLAESFPLLAAFEFVRIPQFVIPLRSNPRGLIVGHILGKRKSDGTYFSVTIPFEPEVAEKDSAQERMAYIKSRISEDITHFLSFSSCACVVGKTCDDHMVPRFITTSILEPGV